MRKLLARVRFAMDTYQLLIPPPAGDAEMRILRMRSDSVFKMRTLQHGIIVRWKKAKNQMTYMYFPTIEILRSIFAVTVISALSVYIVFLSYSDPPYVFGMTLMQLMVHSILPIAFFVEYYTCAHWKYKDDKEHRVDVSAKEWDRFHYSRLKFF
jgi:hypothetical protein